MSDFFPYTDSKDHPYVMLCRATLDIVEDLTVDAGAVRLMLLLSPHMERRGYVEHSNLWLQSKLGLSERTVRRYLMQLEEKGYIWREVWKEEMESKRRIWLPDIYRKFLDAHQIEDPLFEKAQKKKVEGGNNE